MLRAADSSSDPPAHAPDWLRYHRESELGLTHRRGSNPCATSAETSNAPGNTPLAPPPTDRMLGVLDSRVQGASDNRLSDSPTVLMTFPTALGVPGGGTIGCIEISRALRRAGAKVIIVPAMTRIKDRHRFLVPELEQEFSGNPQEQELADLGVEIVRADPVKLHYLFDGLSVRRVVRAVAKNRRIDAVFGWHHEYAYVPHHFRTQGVVTGMFMAGWYDHFIHLRRDTNSLKHLMVRRVEMHQLARGLQYCDRVLAISEFTRDEVARAFRVSPERIDVVRWGVDPIFALPERPPEDAVRRFLFFASPDPRKGALEAIAAFGRIAAQGKRDWEFRVVWQHRDKVAHAAASHGVSDLVTALDPMEHADLVRQLEWAQVAILPSTFESFGLACAEALTSGIPVIAYDAGGVSEVVTDSVSGWLVPNKRADLLDAAILDAMAHPGRVHEMGRAGRARMRKSFTWDNTAVTLLGLVDRVQGSRIVSSRIPGGVRP